MNGIPVVDGGRGAASRGTSIVQPEHLLACSESLSGAVLLVSLEVVLDTGRRA